MGGISRVVFDVARSLDKRISNAYGCFPKRVAVVGGIGYNVGGQEVGRVTDRDDGGVNVRFYAPGSERFLPVFS